MFKNGNASKIFCASLFLFSSISLTWASPPHLTATQKLTIEQITSIFENGTSDFQYDYIEDIGDGAGVTLGRAGFTSTEIQLIVSRYVAANPSSPLAQYLPCLQKMGEGIMQDYSCLYPSVSADELKTQDFKTEGGTIGKVDFGKAWRDAGSDSVMWQVQDDYEDEAYFQPAMKLVDSLGLSTPLAASFIYDACIQMGCDSKIFQVVPEQFAAKHGGRSAPQNLDEETEWLVLYIPERKVELSVTPAGAATVDRVDSLAQILNTKNYQLDLPFEFDYSGHHFSLSDPDQPDQDDQD
jgi:chitosanase